MSGGAAVAGVEVRAGRREDAAAIGTIAGEVHAMHAAAWPGIFQPPGAPVMSAGEVEAMIAAEAMHLLVATRDGVVVGYACAEEQRAPASAYKRAGAALHVHAMATAAGAQRTGAGRALMDALREVARARGLQVLTLEVYAFNDAARGFCASEGFAPVRTLMLAPLDAES